MRRRGGVTLRFSRGRAQHIVAHDRLAIPTLGTHVFDAAERAAPRVTPMPEMGVSDHDLRDMAAHLYTLR